MAKRNDTELDLIDIMKENLSPHCLAAIASCLSIAGNYGDDSEIPSRTRKEVAWFKEQLIEELGATYDTLLEEIQH